MEAREDDKKGGGGAAASSAPGSRFKNLVSREYYSHKKKVPPHAPTLVISRHRNSLPLPLEPKIPARKKASFPMLASFLGADPLNPSIASGKEDMMRKFQHLGRPV
jgi:hypothetical protein